MREEDFDDKEAVFKNWYNTGQGYFYQGWTLKGFPYNKGVYLFKYGKVFIGYTNSNFKFHGPFTKINLNGEVKEGFYQDGYKFGYWITTKLDGTSTARN